MGSVWATIGTILATGVVMVLGNWAQHHWTGKREIRDARRKYRENDVAPIKEALTKIGSDLECVNLKGKLQQRIDDPTSLDNDTLQTFKKTKESIEVIIKNTPIEVLTDMIPLINIVRSEDAKQALREVFFEYTIFYQYAEKNVNTSKDVKDKLDLAYKKLEDYVALAE